MVDPPSVIFLVVSLRILVSPTMINGSGDDSCAGGNGAQRDDQREAAKIGTYLGDTDKSNSGNDPPWKVSKSAGVVVPKFKMPAKHVCSTWHLWRLSMLCKIQWSWMELVPKRSRRVGGSDYHVQLLSVQWTSSRHNMNTLYTFSKCLMNLCKIIYSSIAAGHDGARPLSQASTSTGPSKCNKKKIYLVGEAQGKESQETGLRAQGCQFLKHVVF